jgi:hypothetical protein
MGKIDNIDFTYRKEWSRMFLLRRCRLRQTNKNMKNNVLIAVPFGFSAVAASVLSFYSKLTVESVIGWASVGALLAVAMLDYRIAARRSSTRA